MNLCHRGGRRTWEKKKGEKDIQNGEKDIQNVEKGVVFALERNSVLGHCIVS